MGLQYNGKDEWVSVVDCHHCKKQTLTKETTIISIDYDYFGTKGKTYVNLCKECHRDHQLNKLIKWN
jgi:hypothetical protein